MQNGVSMVNMHTWKLCRFLSYFTRDGEESIIFYFLPGRDCQSLNIAINCSSPIADALCFRTAPIYTFSRTLSFSTGWVQVQHTDTMHMSSGRRWSRRGRRILDCVVQLPLDTHPLNRFLAASERYVCCSLPAGHQGPADIQLVGRRQTYQKATHTERVGRSHQ